MLNVLVLKKEGERVKKETMIPRFVFGHFIPLKDYVS